MQIDRRLLMFSGAAFFAPAAAAAAPPSAASPFGIDAAQLGVRPQIPEDQSLLLQRAIDYAAAQRLPLLLRPGRYRAGGLRLPPGSQLAGIHGATTLVLSQGHSLVESRSADGISLTGLGFDGGDRPLPEGRGLVHLTGGRRARIVDCEVTGSSRNGIVLEGMEGEVRGTMISEVGGAGLFSLDARGLVIANNTVRGCGNNGIQVWRSEAGDDATLVTGNRIEAIAAKGGGSGQNGNAINLFRAGNVVVSNNRIRDVAFTAVRANAASNIQILGNNCSGCGEVAIYAEFGVEGAVIANNSVDGAALGVVVTNFNHGGRLAVVQGNVIRRLHNKRPPGTDPEDGAGIGIGVEADTAVTGNVIEDAPTAGIAVGWGRHLRDVTVTGNVVRNAGVGIAVSVSPGAGAAVIADNLIADAKNGAIVGMNRKHPVSGDLAREGAGRYAQLAISGNRVR